MSSAIRVTYDLKPPTGVDNSGKPTTATHQFPLSTASGPQPARSTADPKVFYADLRVALENARTRVGNELTEWRDAVGKAELNKEPIGKAKDGDLDEDDEDEEGEQEDMS